MTSMIMLVSWKIWKEHNARVFRMANIVITRIKDEPRASGVQPGPIISVMYFHEGELRCRVLEYVLGTCF
jgi:hypothetical protein